MKNIKRVVFCGLLVSGIVPAAETVPSNSQNKVGHDKAKRVSPSELAELRDDLSREGALSALPGVLAELSSASADLPGMKVAGAVEDYSVLVKALRKILHEEGCNSDVLPALVQGALLTHHAMASEDFRNHAK